MIHQALHYLYVHLFNYTDIIGCVLGTSWGLYILTPAWQITLTKAVMTFMLGGIGAIGGWAFKVFVIHPFHKYLKIKFPSSKFFN